MTRGRLLASIILAVWLAVLAMAWQPHEHPPPRITHAHLLDHPLRKLPTLAPSER